MFLGTEAVGRLERRGPSRYRFAYLEGAASRPISRSLPAGTESLYPVRNRPVLRRLAAGGVGAGCNRQLFPPERGRRLRHARRARRRLCRCRLDPEDGAASRPRPLGLPASGCTRSSISSSRAAAPPAGVDPRPEGVRLEPRGSAAEAGPGRDAEGFSQPLHGSPSTCLLKPEFGQYPTCVVNEAFCMRIAEAAGLRPASTSIVDVTGPAASASIVSTAAEPSRRDRTNPPGGPLSGHGTAPGCEVRRQRRTIDRDGGRPDQVSTQRLHALETSLTSSTRCTSTSCWATAMRTGRTSRSSTT